jgi:hypothetical protein
MREGTSMSKRWIVFLLLFGTIDGLGPHTATADVLMSACEAATVWFFAFDAARAGRAWLFAETLTRAFERQTLFVAALIAAAMIGFGGTAVIIDRTGSTLLYVVLGCSIARQGHRIGSRRLAGWEYQDELYFGALGSLAASLAAAGVTIALGQIPNAVELLLIVTPVGLIALSDEPLYVSLEPYVRQYFMEVRKRESQLRANALVNGQ